MAYRSGELLYDQRTGLTHDYRQKQGVEFCAIVTPEDHQISREDLWNLAEAAEVRKDARTAREWEVALPDELNLEQRKALTFEFARALSERYGVAVDFALHEPAKGGDHRNYHAHVMTTTREYKQGSLGAKSSIELSNSKREQLGLNKSQDEIKVVRALWAQQANKALELAGYETKIDHRSHLERGLEAIPTIKMGKTATQMERRGILTQKGNINRHNLALNGDIHILRHEQRDLVLKQESVAQNVEKMLEKGIESAWAKFEKREKQKQLAHQLKDREELSLGRGRDRGLSL